MLILKNLNFLLILLSCVFVNESFSHKFINKNENNNKTSTELSETTSNLLRKSWHANPISESFFSKFADLNEISGRDDDELCSRHLKQIVEGLERQEMWALEFIDSWGKIPTGILYGHTWSIGNFDECLSARSNSSINPGNEFRGKYCLPNVPISKLLPPKSNLRMMPNGQSNEIGFRIGICIPSTCNADTLNKELSEILEKLLNQKINSTILTDATCSTDEKSEFRALDWIAVAIFTFFGVIILLSTFYEYIQRQRSAQRRPLFIAFSVITNGEKMFHMQNSKSPNSIECLHGIRVLSLMWVVFGHSYVMAAFTPIVNSKYILEWAQTPYSMLLQSATVSVDSFFLMSGLLVGWVAFHHLQRTRGSLNIFVYYLHRFLRLTPVLAAIILFCVTFNIYIGSGPIWHELQYISRDPCEEYWWSAILYVQNYVNPDKVCLGHTWYLAVDTQLFVISPILILGLWKWGWEICVFILLLMAGSIGCVFAIYMKYDFSLLMMNAMLTSQDRMKKTYYVTHTRMSPWLLGLLLGYFLFKIKDKRFKLPKIAVLLGWIVSLVTIAAVIFGPYPKTQPGAKETTLEAAFYESFSRTAWAAGLGWIIFACHRGYGGLINTVLSYPFWQPFSRLSYSIYLVSLTFQSIVAGNSKTDSHFSDFESMYRFWGDFAFTVLFSIIISLAFESPIIGLEKLIFTQRKSNEDERNLVNGQTEAATTSRNNEQNP